VTGPGAVLTRCVTLWDVAPGTLTPVRQGANFVYEFQAHRCRFFLRLTNDHHRSLEQLEGELDFVRFVASRGVDVSCPQPSQRGNQVETFETDDGETWHAVVFAAMAGAHFRFFSADVDAALFRVWGYAMGALHFASRDFVPRTSRRPLWNEQDTTSCDPGKIPFAEATAQREHERIAEWLAARPATAESWGLIHGDFERTNFVLSDGTVHLFDFDDACYHWYVADIAHALWAFRNAPPADRSRFLEWFLQGYRERCPIGSDLRESLSWFVRLRTLSLFSARLQDEASAEWVWRTRVSLKTPFCW
jgi:amicoumacin kinase